MKNRITKTITGVALATILFTGCSDGIDDKQYAMLTGDKTFQQIKNAYSTSVSNELKEDQKIYEKWLKKYSDVDPAFDFTAYHASTQIKYSVTIGNIKNLMKELKKKKNHNKRDLKRELRTAEILSSNIKFVRTDYIPFLKSLLNKKDESKKYKETKLLPYPINYTK